MSETLTGGGGGLSAGNFISYNETVNSARNRGGGGEAGKNKTVGVELDEPATSFR